MVSCRTDAGKLKEAEKRRKLLSISGGVGQRDRKQGLQGSRGGENVLRE